MNLPSHQTPSSPSPNGDNNTGPTAREEHARPLPQQTQHLHAPTFTREHSNHRTKPSQLNNHDPHSLVALAALNLLQQHVHLTSAPFTTTSGQPRPLQRPPLLHPLPRMPPPPQRHPSHKTLVPHWLPARQTRLPTALLAPIPTTASPSPSPKPRPPQQQLRRCHQRQQARAPVRLTRHILRVRGPGP